MGLKEKQAERLKQWRERIAEQKQSGKSIRAFCQERGLREHSFYFWRVRLRTGSGAKPLRFALVESNEKSSPKIEVQLSSGEKLSIAGGDAATLRMVLNVLREAR